MSSVHPVSCWGECGVTSLICIDCLRTPVTLPNIITFYLVSLNNCDKEHIFAPKDLIIYSGMLRNSM